MADKTVTIRTRKYMTNRLLARKQMVRNCCGSGACFLCPQCAHCGALAMALGDRLLSRHPCLRCAQRRQMLAARGGAARRRYHSARASIPACSRHAFAIIFFPSQIIDVFHPNRANVPKSELKEQLAKIFKVNDSNTIFVFGFKTVFGGAKTTGFALIYDNFEQALKFEPKYRLIRVRLCEGVI